MERAGQCPSAVARLITRLAGVPAGAPHALREYLRGDLLMLNLVEDAHPKT